MREKCVIVKLGGSLITKKDKPLTPDLRNLEIVSREIAAAVKSGFSDRIFLIHGGGSFGHFYAKKYGISTDFAKNPEPEAVSKIGLAMIELHLLVLKHLDSAG